MRTMDIKKYITALEFVPKKTEQVSFIIKYMLTMP